MGVAVAREVGRVEMFVALLTRARRLSLRSGERLLAVHHIDPA